MEVNENNDKTLDFQSREYGSHQVMPLVAKCDLSHKPRYFDEKLEWGGSSHKILMRRVDTLEVWVYLCSECGIYRIDKLQMIHI